MKKHRISGYFLKLSVISFTSLMCSYTIGAHATANTDSSIRQSPSSVSSPQNPPIGSFKKNAKKNGVTKNGIQTNQRQESSAICSGRDYITYCGNLNGRGKDKCNNYYSIKNGQQYKCQMQNDDYTCDFESKC